MPSFPIPPSDIYVNSAMRLRVTICNAGIAVSGLHQVTIVATVNVVSGHPTVPRVHLPSHRGEYDVACLEPIILC